MQAIRVSEAGGSPVLENISPPRPGPGELAIRVRACGLNFADLLVAKGEYQERPGFPVTLGMEVAGVVEALGPGVSGPPPGSRVAGVTSHGGLAELALVPEQSCVKLPDRVTFRDAAALQVAYGTSHLALTRRARLAPGETLLVLGAAGGVGLTAVEIGRLMGARVIACARGAAKLAVAEAAGAAHLVDSESGDLRAELKALGGADVVYDPVGGALGEAALRACRPEARVLLVGFASGNLPQLRPNHLLVKNVSVEGFYWGGYRHFAPGALTASLAELMGWLESGRIRPHVGAVLPLARAAEGLELLRSRASTGKVVIEIG